jgi:putative membrane protein
MDAPADRSSNDLALERTRLAIFRTELASSRSLMAWVRTGLSLIGFGFTVYKFVQSSSETLPETAALPIGLSVIGLGVFAILLGCVEFWRTSQEIEQTFNAPMRKFPLILAALAGTLGLILLLVVIALEN